MANITPFTTGIAQVPVANTEFITAGEAFSTLSALYSAAGDTITPGTATGSQILQDLAIYITDEEALLATLESLAANNTAGAAGWAAPEISWLQNTIAAELSLLYEDGGTLSGETEVSAMSGIPLNCAGSATVTVPNPRVRNPLTFPSLSLPDSSAVADLYLFGEHGNIDLATLSQIVGRDTTSTLIGRDAAAVLAAYSAGANPFFALNVLFDDAANPNITSSTTTSNPASLFTPATFSSLSLPDSSAVADLYQFGAHGNIDLATLSQIVGRDTTSTIIGQDAAAVLAAYSSGVNPFIALGQLFMDAENPNITSSTTATGSTMVWTGSTFVSSGLSSADAAAVATLSANPWNATNSSLIMTTLSQIVAQDTASTILGADAAAALTLISASQSPSQAIALLLGDAASPNITSHTTTISGFSAQDRANIAIATADDDVCDWSSFDATLSSLATSSNPIIATIASTGLNPDAAPWDVVDALYYYAIGSVIPGGAADPTFSVAIASLAVELSSATGSTMIWTGSTFTVSGGGNFNSSAMAILSAYPGTTTLNLFMATLSSIVTQDGSTTVWGADAVVALEMISAGVDPSSAVAVLLTDLGDPTLTSSQVTIENISVRDRANIKASYYDSANRSAELETLSTLATSSNQTIANIASADLTIVNSGGDPSIAFDEPLLWDMLAGTFTSATMSAFTAQLSSATGSTMIWTGSNFVVSAATSSPYTRGSPF